MTTSLREAQAQGQRIQESNNAGMEQPIPWILFLGGQGQAGQTPRWNQGSEGNEGARATDNVAQRWSEH